MPLIFFMAAPVRKTAKKSLYSDLLKKRLQEVVNLDDCSLELEEHSLFSIE